MRARITVAILVAVLGIYFWFLTDRALLLIGSGEIVGVGLGVGVLLLPLIGIVLVVMELRFGAASARLSRRLQSEGVPPEGADLPRRPSGRVERAAADEYFGTVKDRVEADPDNWRGWFALGEAYELAGDRKRARAAIRTAIELESRGDAAAPGDQTATRSNPPE
ncbi:hypothetical protein GIS00_07205 [Nakamurella sp. YIM 132087]|uniref:Tetratricopeptide repeat protein n=1 Tax=Nakamurella alba TaxID=2665158 RepID=A0A7K1FJX3_9ACTN|nr:hypothetical protein [Nakamurella alba]MTD13729.1 hypothetical protein [Nakamurella alba]